MKQSKLKFEKAKTGFIIFSFAFCIVSSCNNSNQHNTKDDVDSTKLTLAQISADSLKNLHICTALINDSRPIDLTKKAFGKPDLFWPENTKTLKVEFLDGNPLIQQKVEKSAKIWEDYCGIKFEFGNFPKADITITFKQRGSWSYIGSDSKNNIPSMNYGWFDQNTPQQEYDRVVLHEFGHALGLYHEHQNPKDNPIKWNKPIVYQYYMGPPNNWSKDKIDYNIFLRYNINEYNGTEFDPESIMQYFLPAVFTTNGYHIDEVYTLSDKDKIFINNIYPK
jgi:hypothetical protein